jgi:hypothetical protein
VQSFHPVENDEQSASDPGFFPSQIPEKFVKQINLKKYHVQQLRQFTKMILFELCETSKVKEITIIVGHVH